MYLTSYKDGKVDGNTRKYVSVHSVILGEHVRTLRRSLTLPLPMKGEKN